MQWSEGQSGGQLHSEAVALTAASVVGAHDGSCLQAVEAKAERCRGDGCMHDSALLSPAAFCTALVLRRRRCSTACLGSGNGNARRVCTTATEDVEGDTMLLCGIADHARALLLSAVTSAIDRCTTLLSRTQRCTDRLAAL